MRKLFFVIPLTVLIVLVGLSQSKLFAITGNETTIIITFADAAAKQTFLNALAIRGSYQEQRNDKGEVLLTKEEFVFNELTQFFGDAIIQQRVRVAVEAAAAAVPKDDIPDKKSPRAIAVKPR